MDNEIRPRPRPNVRPTQDLDAIKQAPKKSRTKRWLMLAGLIVLLTLAAGGWFLWTKRQTKQAAQPVANQSYFPSGIGSQMTIPVYYPVNLPAGFSVASFAVIKQNVLFYSVTNKAGDKFNVTIQPLPSTFDFVGFQKKFFQPDQYQTPIGSNLVGVAGTTLIGSIQTTKNVWILLNSNSVDQLKDMETITRAFRQVSL